MVLDDPRFADGEEKIRRLIGSANQNPIDPMGYVAERTNELGIEMHCWCDGDVIYDGQVHGSYEEARCELLDSMGPHMIYHSEPRNGKRFVILEQPDEGKPAKIVGNTAHVRTIYTFKVIGEDDDPHTEKGEIYLKIRPDEEVVETPETETERSWQAWIEAMLTSL